MEPLTGLELQQQLLAVFDDLVSLLGVMSHPKRLRVLISLLGGAKSFGELLAETKLRKSALASHLGQLQEKELIEKVSHGVYELTERGRGYLVVFAQFFGSAEDLEISLQRIRGARSFLERREE